jgi:hypothetical protein
MNYLNDINIIDNIQNITLNQHSVIFICLYKINYINNYPYLTYLLYKQNIQNKEICSFLYIHFDKNNKHTFKQLNNMLDYLPYKNIDFKGYLQNKNMFYLFYEQHADTLEIYKYTKKSLFYWATIYEITQLQSIINIPIHSTVFELFYSNKKLIHLYILNEIIAFPITIYTQDSTIDVFANYDSSNKYFTITHNYQLYNGNFKRCILIYQDCQFSNNDNNILHFKNIEQLQIISE